MKTEQSLSLRILTGLAAVLMAVVVASSICGFILRFYGSVKTAPLIFALTIVITSYLTDMYWPGITVSLLAIVISEYYFNAPFRSFEGFSLFTAGVDFAILLPLSILTSYITMNMRQLEKLRQEAEHEKLRANILRAVSHDIRTPLTSIVGTTSAILDESIVLSEQTKAELMQDVQSDAKWLIQMTENFLMATRMGAERENPRHEEILEDLIGDVARKFRKHNTETHLSIDIPPEIVFVVFDAVLIKHVIMNILENAVLHGEAKNIAIKVSVQEHQILFSIENDGEKMQNNPFKYVEKKINDNKRSIGIGMTVCYSIIKAHGGNFYAENLQQGGVRFTFSLPREEKDMNDYVSSSRIM